MPFSPIIAPEIFALRPDFTALSIYIENGSNAASDAHSRSLLADACSQLGAATWAEAHLDNWRMAYQAFGAKPKKTPCSAEALRKRAERDGQSPSVNAVVDLYNALSLRFALPIGGEDALSYDGAPRLRRALGSETFDTVAEGAPKIETVESGEVIWCDATGVTCRRWNWRQGVRTRITETSTDMWFVLERLDPMPLAALLQAGEALITGLQRLSPDLRATQLLCDMANPAGRPVSAGA